MSIFLQIIKPEALKQPFQDKVDFSGVYCPFCKTYTNNRTHRFKNTRSLWFHLKEFHRYENGIVLVLDVLQQVSVARQLGMIL